MAPKIRPLKDRFWTHVDRESVYGPRGDCWKWTGSGWSSGYGKIHRQGSDSVPIGAHQASYEIHFGEIPKGLCVLHSCDVRDCVNPAHLYLGTRERNIRDCVMRGRQGKGERARAAKLTARQVLEIRRLYSTGEHTLERLAERFRCTYSNIGMIVRHDTWKHVH